jgi:hypothetical protein
VSSVPKDVMSDVQWVVRELQNKSRSDSGLTGSLHQRLGAESVVEIVTWLVNNSRAFWGISTVHYRVHEPAAAGPVPSQVTVAPTLTTPVFKVRSDRVLPSTLRCWKLVFSFQIVRTKFCMNLYHRLLDDVNSTSEWLLFAMLHFAHIVYLNVSCDLHVFFCGATAQIGPRPPYC